LSKVQPKNALTKHNNPLLSLSIFILFFAATLNYVVHIISTNFKLRSTAEQMPALFFTYRPIDLSRGELRPILNFAHRGKLWAKLAPRGEFCPSRGEVMPRG
jgi:hypothetical protein